MIQQQIDLLPFNSFGIRANAAFFAAVKSVGDLQFFIKSQHTPKRVLGGGSNILLTGHQEGLILRNEIKGKKIIRRTRNKIHVAVGGGENWHEFVLWAVENNWGGIENLSLIPGTVGAAPVQNIGAYGVEIKDVFVKLTAVDLESGKERVFSRKQCEFGYRDSIFKRWAKGKFMITSVVFSLNEPHHHRLNISYGDIAKTLENMGITAEPSIKQVSDAVVSIRTSKLPDPAKIGNCGSFFKNPELDRPLFDRIKKDYPTIPGFPLDNDKTKVPAGWLIEQCGWKGKRVGNTGCYEKQALVLINYGNATGAEVQQLASDIIASVQNKFGVSLEPEVNIW